DEHDENWREQTQQQSRVTQATAHPPATPRAIVRPRDCDRRERRWPPRRGYSARATRAIPSTVRMSRAKENQSFSRLIATESPTIDSSPSRTFSGADRLYPVTDGRPTPQLAWTGRRSYGSAMLRVMSQEKLRFDAPSPIERLFSRMFGALVGLGLGFSHNHQLQVRGRRSGRLYST